MNSLELARQSSACLANLIREDGSFRYRYDSRSGDILGGYNILRHAGSIWAMLDVYRDVPDEKILESSKRATHYLLASSLKFYRRYTNACICEENAIKLGGNARPHWRFFPCSRLPENASSCRSPDSSVSSCSTSGSNTANWCTKGISSQARYPDSNRCTIPVRPCWPCWPCTK